MTKEELENVAEDRFEEKPLGYESKPELMIYRDGFVEGYEYCQASTVSTDNTETLENALKRIAELEQENAKMAEAKEIIAEFLHLVEYFTTAEDERKLRDRAERFLGIEIKRMTDVEGTK